MVRGLRIREDTAKYLRNLDPNSAAYSGKSRTMNDNPNPDMASSKTIFKGDNMAKFSGDFLQYLNQEAFTLEATQAGVEVNHVAMPSQVEILHKQFKEKKELLKQKKIQDLLAKYGGEKHLVIPDDIRAALDPTVDEIFEQKPLAQHKTFTVLSAPILQHKASTDNRGILGVVSKYEEDIHENGHSTVWGSYWHPVLGWGYRCCFSFDKKGKCRGEESKVETIKKEYELELQAKSL